jgi:hypothetical protein
MMAVSFPLLRQTALLCLNTGLAFLVAMAALDNWIYCQVGGCRSRSIAVLVRTW